MGHKSFANKAKGKRPVIDDDDSDFAPLVAKGSHRPVKKKSKVSLPENNFNFNSQKGKKKSSLRQL
ncbi:hypothetical protein CsatA_015581 [Cannabis sativa]